MRAILSNKKTISRVEKAAVVRFLKWQSIVAVLLVLVAWLLFSVPIMQSVFLGTMLTIVPNIVLAIYLFIRAEKRSPKQVMRACYVGEMFKILVIAVMLIAMLHFFQLQLSAFLVGFLGTYMLYWMAPVILKQNGSKVVR